MSTPVLITKLYIPPPRPDVVLRPRLIERLNEGLHRNLTLISAPAGFGKTTLVSDWVATCGRSVAWLSLEEGDSEPIRFLTYLVSALQTVAATIGDGVLRTLESPHPPPTESILTALVNEIAALPNTIVVVLDDYHLIDAKPIDDALTFLLEHQPPRMHLIMTTREDPRLSLARLRAKGQLTEVRAADLRFSPQEAAAFFNEVMGLDLSAGDAAALETRTEGWIAGLQLAALSMRGRADVPGFIRTFAGDDRYIVDYLVEEVLRRQPERVRRFLLATSILDRLSGSLCDAVTGHDGGKGLLEALERGNLFVVPLDDKRHWYRYHHLFADVLQAHAMEEQPHQVAVRHRRASEWHEQHGAMADAIRHALAAEDFARAANLVELAWPALQRGRQEAAALGWLKALPDELFHRRPVLSVGYAMASMSCGEFAGVEARLRDAERWLDTTGEGWAPCTAEMVVVDQAEFQRLPRAIAVARAGQALVQGDVSATATYARRALDLVPEDDHLWRGAAAALLGLASWTSGNLEAARRAYADGMAILQRAGNIADAIGGALALADIRIAQGRLRQAMRIYERGLQLAIEHGDPVMRGTADMYVGMSELHREFDDLHAATQHLLRSEEQGEHTGFPQNPYRSRVASARVREAQGDLDGALDLLDEAEYRYVSDFYPNVRPIAAWKTRVWVAQGRLEDALDWARERNLTVEDDLSYLREFEHITLARVLLARSRRDREDHSMREVVELLERLRQAAEDGGRTGSFIEILALLALAHEALGDVSRALAPLERALALAEPEGYVRVFVSEGRPMAQLLVEAAAQGITPAYTSRLLSALHGVLPPSERPLPLPPATRAQPLIEPLSRRELEVLHLIAQGLSNHEISERLYLALSTVKGHNRVIFGKLDVQRRTEAVSRARKLGLL